MPVQDPPKNKFQAQGKVKVIQGSILAPHNAGLRFVLSATNMTGKTENPLYSLFDKKWPKAKQEAKGWFNTRDGKYKLGAVNTTAVQSDTWIIHCLVQDEELKTDLEAVKKCLKEVCKMAKYERASIHVSSLLVEAVPEITDLLNTELADNGVSVSFYEESVNG